MWSLRSSDMLICALVVLVMRLGGYFTRQGMAWYATLNRPSITPPGWVFSVAWTIIYIGIACSLILFWRLAIRGRYFNFIILLWVINAVVHVLWTYLFFARHAVVYALIDCFILLFSTWVLIGLVMPISFLCAVLLLPYGFWLGLACYLNWQFLVINALW